MINFFNHYASSFSQVFYLHNKRLGWVVPEPRIFSPWTGHDSVDRKTEAMCWSSVYCALWE